MKKTKIHSDSGSNLFSPGLNEYTDSENITYVKDKFLKTRDSIKKPKKIYSTNDIISTLSLDFFQKP